MLNMHCAFLLIALLSCQVMTNCHGQTLGTPSRGTILVAHESMRDGLFAETVVLLTDSGADGAVGLVLNRPLPVTVGEALGPRRDSGKNAEPIYWGGPVEQQTVRVLAKSGETSAESERILADVLFFGQQKPLEDFIARHGDVDLNYYAGIAAWAPGQLESELARGDWHLMRADSTLVFTTETAGLWRGLLQRLKQLWVNVE